MIKVLKFSASWCGPCKVLSQTLKGVDGIEEIDVDSNPQLTAEYNVRSVPTLVFLKNEQEVERTKGAIPLEKYNQIISNLNK